MIGGMKGGADLDNEAIADEAYRAVADLLGPEDGRHLRTMFRLALIKMNEQVAKTSDGTAYVATGDIPAEWLRDSSAQVRPYLYFARESRSVADTLRAVIERQARCINLDPYANAFREDYTVWERKFELDSLCYPILLAWAYWKITGDQSVFTPAVKAAFQTALETMLTEQDHDGMRPGHQPSLYHFASDTQSSGKNPVGFTGMIWTAFRPSDDECTYNYLIPAQVQAVQALAALGEMEDFIGRPRMSEAARRLAMEVRAGIEKYGIVETEEHGRIYAYEVDGLGNANLMDDANIPSLLSIPYFGYAANTDPTYVATRRYILSPANPFLFRDELHGAEMSGIGSPHTPPGMIWPLSLVMQGITASHPDEALAMLKAALRSDPGDNLLHESFLARDPKTFTRDDFGWPNALFVEFILVAILGWPPLPVPPVPRVDPAIWKGVARFSSN